MRRIIFPKGRASNYHLNFGKSKYGTWVFWLKRSFFCAVFTPHIHLAADFFFWEPIRDKKSYLRPVLDNSPQLMAKVSAYFDCWGQSQFLAVLILDLKKKLKKKLPLPK
jgi:hypothetical protein